MIELIQNTRRCPRCKRGQLALSEELVGVDRVCLACGHREYLTHADGYAMLRRAKKAWRAQRRYYRLKREGGRRRKRSA